MGWTGYGPGVTADEAKRAEFGTSHEVVAKSGNWWLLVPTYPEAKYPAVLAYFLTSREGGGIAVKSMDVTMGCGTPPTSIARKYVEYWGGDIEKAGGSYGVEPLREALSRKKISLKKGDTFTLANTHRTYPGGSADGTYTYEGGYIAFHHGLQTKVRLFKTFRKHIQKKGT